MAAKTGRPNQRQRTRKDLLQAAGRLLKQGRTPTLDEVAAEALVSRATAYRYFPGVEALLAEASVDVTIPTLDELFAGAPGDDPVARLDRVDAALQRAVVENEVALRLMLAHTMERRARGQDASAGGASGGDAVPLRQNRRTPMIEAALAPARRRFDPAALDRLTAALALIVGTEAMIVFRDVLQVDDEEARRVKQWAIAALVKAAERAR